ncbi:MAG: hypothetical protein GC149_12435 [Gammaproteobacteria bacterium]|nr:hypothetical protein [Gammaproteobacteria bacterium]
MGDIPRHLEPIEQNDLWSLADTLPQDQVVAIARERAALGDITSKAFLAMIAEQAQEREAFRAQAAEDGDVISMLALAGQSLASGDQAQALLWFERAAAQDNAEAHVQLGIMLAKGQGVTPDPIAAITHICTARQTLDKDTFIEFVLDEQDFPFDLADLDVYYPHVIERIFADYSAEDKQRVYDYLHQHGMQAESDEEPRGSAPGMAGTPALDYAPKWLSQFLRGLASQSDSMAEHARRLTAVLEGVHHLQAQETDSLEVAWFDALHQPEAFMAQLHTRFPLAPMQLTSLYAEDADALKHSFDVVWPSLRHAYRRIQQQQRERESAVSAYALPVQTTITEADQPGFAPYKFNVTPVRCSNRACTWTGIMAETDNQRCPVCRSFPVFRVGGAKLLNGSRFATQRDSLLRKHLTALRTVSWFLYASTDSYHALAAGWGNAAYVLVKTG